VVAKCNSASVPAQQRLRLDEETGPARSGQHAASGSERRSVGGPSLGRAVAAQHHELVTQNEDLQILGGVATGQLDKQLDGAAQRQVGESGNTWERPPQRDEGSVTVPTRVDRTRRPPTKSEFLHPTGTSTGVRRRVPATTAPGRQFVDRPGGRRRRPPLGLRQWGKSWRRAAEGTPTGRRCPTSRQYGGQVPMILWLGPGSVLPTGAAAASRR
jgi:hypothetical protein